MICFVTYFLIQDFSWCSSGSPGRTTRTDRAPLQLTTSNRFPAEWRRPRRRRGPGTFARISTFLGASSLSATALPVVWKRPAVLIIGSWRATTHRHRSAPAAKTRPPMINGPVWHSPSGRTSRGHLVSKNTRASRGLSASRALMSIWKKP